MAMAVIAEIRAGPRIKAAIADAAGPVPLGGPWLGPVIGHGAAIGRGRPVIPVTRSRRIDIDSAARLREDSADDGAERKARQNRGELTGPVVRALLLALT